MDKDKIIYIEAPSFDRGCWRTSFHVPDRVRNYFIEESIWFECREVGKVPPSIAVVPAVSMLLPFAWIFNLTISVGQLDESFCESIQGIKRGYREMLPKLALGGGLQVEEMVSDDCGIGVGSPLALFSGGVDAWCTLVRHLDERPRLVTVWGSDIRPDNEEGWAKVRNHSAMVAESLGFNYSQVRSNFKTLLDQRALNDCLMKMGTPYTWWHDVQHGIGLLSLTVPLAYTTGAPLTYIASSFFEGDKGKYTCASDPMIDNMFAAGPMCGCHDGYELTRQDKIETIVDYGRVAGSAVNLRVCFHSQLGDNCCLCEKCGRTILGIYAAGGDPRDFGFSYSSAKLRILAFRMRFFHRMRVVNYRPIIQDALIHKDNIPLCFSWIFDSDFEMVCDNSFKRFWEHFHGLGAGIYHRLVRKWVS